MSEKLRSLFIHLQIDARRVLENGSHRAVIFGVDHRSLTASVLLKRCPPREEQAGTTTTFSKRILSHVVPAQSPNAPPIRFLNIPSELLYCARERRLSLHDPSATHLASLSLKSTLRCTHLVTSFLPSRNSPSSSQHGIIHTCKQLASPKLKRYLSPLSEKATFTSKPGTPDTAPMSSLLKAKNQPATPIANKLAATSTEESLPNSASHVSTSKL